jgi:hypothetical protein
MKKTLQLFAFMASSLSFGQVAIGSGTTVDSNAGLSTPISIYYSTSLSQFIYLASEIGTAGTISSLDFKVNTAGALPNSNSMIDVWVGHTTRSSYNPVVSTTGADWISVASHTQVMTSGSFTQTGTTLTFTFTTPFVYNGTDNLVITVDANKTGNDGSSVLFLQTAATTDKMSLMIRTDNAADNANPLNPPLNYTGGFAAASVQAKTTRPQIVLNGLTLGVEEHNLSDMASVYPNPVKGDLFIKSQSNATAAEIYNLAGQLIKSTEPEENKIATADLSSGIYIVKLSFEDGLTTTKKFVKE